MRHVVSEEEKRKIVTEYLKGGETLRSLEAKHGYDFRTIGAWVKSYKEKAGEILEKIAPVKEKRTTSDTEFIASIASVCQRYGLNADISIKDGKIHETKIFG